MAGRSLPFGAALIAVGLTLVVTFAVMVFSGKPLGMMREYRAALTIMTQAQGVNDVGFGDEKRLLKTMLMNLFLVLFVLMRQSLVQKASDATGWNVGVIYAVPRLLLVLLWCELSVWVIRSQNRFLRSEE